MATQRLTVTTIAGDAGATAEQLFRTWREGPAPDRVAVDRFCERVRANGSVLPIVFFCEWIDRWLMGDLIPGPGAVEGRRYQVTCLSPTEATAWAGRCGHQFPEQKWLARRLREAAAAWKLVADHRAVIVVREVLDVSTTDAEVTAALRGVPAWLSAEESDDR